MLSIMYNFISSRTDCTCICCLDTRIISSILLKQNKLYEIGRFLYIFSIMYNLLN